MDTWIIGDLHFGHKNITRFRTQFATMEEHEEFIMDNWSVKNGGDKIFFMGDAAFTWEGLRKISKLRGQKILIRGNHDTLSTNMYLAVFKEVYGLFKYKAYWMSHAPIHPAELRGLMNIHGHVHSETIPDPRYINVCPEVIGYAPVRFQELIENHKKQYDLEVK